ncbi:MAG: pleD [Myxococcales bacterium]|nr:pleD [Myxococcales bacterium]
MMAKILVVEDDPWSQRIVCDVLMMHGHDVLTADGVSSARMQLVQRPEIVLLDINIPGGGGEAFLHEIRADDAQLPVIALTASAMQGDRERFLKQGFTAYMSKPIDVRTFAATVEEYVR